MSGNVIPQTVAELLQPALEAVVRAIADAHSPEVARDALDRAYAKVAHDSAEAELAAKFPDDPA